MTGSVVYNYINENWILKKGDTICVVDTEILDTQISFNKKYRRDNELYLSDLKNLSEADFSIPFNTNKLKTEVYRSSANELMQRVKQNSNRIAKTRTDFNRDKKLFDSQVLSSKEFEKTTYEYDQAKSNDYLVKKEKKAQWEMDKLKYSNEIEETISKTEQLEKERDRYFLIAPISGVVQQYSGVRVGSFVYANQKLGEISPDSSLISELYISPSDIGFIDVGNTIKLQVDAFNYNQWGMLDAEIIEVSDDIIMINQIPSFRIKCSFI